MSAWQPIKTAPKDGTPVLGWGRLIVGDDDQATPRGPRRAVIYWDEIDQAWCASTHPWDGPFFEPSLWARLLETPAFAEWSAGLSAPNPVDATHQMTSENGGEP
jgi:hypothetical protein